MVSTSYTSVHTLYTCTCIHVHVRVYMYIRQHNCTKYFQRTNAQISDCPCELHPFVLKSMYMICIDVIDQSLLQMKNAQNAPISVEYPLTLNQRVLVLLIEHSSVALNVQVCTIHVHMIQAISHMVMV